VNRREALLPLQEAYRTCETITWHQARNFAYGIRLLPPEKRRRLSAVYAYARRIDDIGDSDLPSPERLRLLQREAELLEQPPDPDDPVRVALADVAACGIDLRPFHELIDGCRDDVLGRSYRTDEDLYRYCRKVAGSIGRLSLSVFGTPCPEQEQPLGDALGTALQLTNILRDIGEDARRGRVYLPESDLRLFRCTIRVGQDAPITATRDQLVTLVRFEADRARTWYARGLQLLPLLDRRSRACCAALAGVYLRLLNQIEADPARVLLERTSVPVRAKLAVVGKALALGSAGPAR
jgi:phytoene synthase